MSEHKTADTCSHCSDPVDDKARAHWDDIENNDLGHQGLCCDCFDLSCGHPIDELNEERVAAGKKPLLPLDD